MNKTYDVEELLLGCHRSDADRLWIGQALQPSPPDRYRLFQRLILDTNYSTVININNC